MRHCWKELGHLCDGAGPSAILFVCSFADPTLFPSLFASVLKFTVFKLCIACFQCVNFLPDSFISEVVSFPLLALIQIRAFSGVTTKRQSPGSLMSHEKKCYAYCCRPVTPNSTHPITKGQTTVKRAGVGKAKFREIKQNINVSEGQGPSPPALVNASNLILAFRTSQYLQKN